MERSHSDWLASPEVIFEGIVTIGKSMSVRQILYPVPFEDRDIHWKSIVQLHEGQEICLHRDGILVTERILCPQPARKDESETASAIDFEEMENASEDFHHTRLGVKKEKGMSRDERKLLKKARKKLSRGYELASP